MGSLGSGEILVIAVAALIVFGPKRLPEIARKASQLLVKTREATHSVTSALDGEFDGVAAPLQALKAEYDATMKEIKGAATSVGDAAMSAGDTTTPKKADVKSDDDMAVTIPLDDELPGGGDAATANREPTAGDMAVTIPLDDELPGEGVQARDEADDTQSDDLSPLDDELPDEGVQARDEADDTQSDDLSPLDDESAPS